MTCSQPTTRVEYYEPSPLVRFGANAISQTDRTYWRRFIEQQIKPSVQGSFYLRVKNNEAGLREALRSKILAYDLKDSDCKRPTMLAIRRGAEIWAALREIHLPDPLIMPAADGGVVFELDGLESRQAMIEVRDDGEGTFVTYGIGYKAHAQKLFFSPSGLLEAAKSMKDFCEA